MIKSWASSGEVILAYSISWIIYSFYSSHYSLDKTSLSAPISDSATASLAETS